MKTKEDLKNMTRTELLKLAENAKGCTKNNPNEPETYFKGKFDTEFTYSDLTNQLRASGAVNGWYYPDELGKCVTNEVSLKDDVTILEMNKAKGSELSKKTFVIEKCIEEEWAEFVSNTPSKSMVLGVALKKFMDEARAGKIKLVCTWN